MDQASHKLWRGRRERTRDRSGVLSGRVVEVSEDRQMVKVELAEGLEPAWVQADGVTALGATASVSVGARGLPVARAATRAIPEGAEVEYVGPTGAELADHARRMAAAEESLTGTRENLAAAQQQIAEAMAELEAAEQRLGGLTAEGVEAMPEEAAEALYAKLGVVGRLQALQGVVTRDMIATGAVTASQMTVTGELAAQIASVLTLAVERLNVGRNARFTEAGLVFYAPPAAGQAWDDWEHRTPLVQLAPGGDVSVAVASGGRVTAGMTEEGTVWGRAGRFETLEIGGRELTQVISEGPRGVLGVTRVAGTIQLTNSGRLMFGVRAQMYKGRLYRYDYNLGISRDRGEVLVDTYLEHNGRHYKVGSSATGHNGDVTSGCIIVADEYDFADGEPVGVLTSVYTKTQGARGTLWGAPPNQRAAGSWVMLSDIGGGITPYVHQEQSSSSSTAPKATLQKAVTSAQGIGLRPDGSRAPDGRLTVGGNRLYGSDMAEHVYYRTDLGFLNGAEVLEADVVLTVTQSAYASQGTALYVAAARFDGLGGAVNLQEVTAYPGGQVRVRVPGAHLHHLVGAKGIILSPKFPGAHASYGYVAPAVAVYATYRK